MHPVRLSSVFQPIVSFADPRYPRALEALARFPDGRRPDLVFADAWAAGTGDRLELAALNAHLDNALGIPTDIALSVNLATETVTRHAEGLSHLLRRTSRLIIVELTEATDQDDLRSIAALRASGVALALDDAGAGRTGVARILRLSPDIVKLDRALLLAARSNRAANTLVRDIVGAAKTVNAELVAEGVETTADSLIAIGLGITLGQGYAFGAPAPAAHFSRLRRSA